MNLLVGHVLDLAELLVLDEGTHAEVPFNRCSEKREPKIRIGQREQVAAAQSWYVCELSDNLPVGPVLRFEMA